MLKFGCFDQIAPSTSSHGFPTSSFIIKVLVLAQRNDVVANFANLFFSIHTFEVTCVEYYDAALRLLSDKKNKFDVLLIDSNTNGVDIHAFLRLTKDKVAISIVMSEQEDLEFIQEVFRNGGCLVFKCPITIEALSCIRQEVIKKRMDMQEKSKNKNILLMNAIEDMKLNENKCSSTKRRGRCSLKNNVYQSSEDDDNDGCTVKKKICVEWTNELHEKFLNAVNELGEESCFPKKILDIMRVSGLTRMQVASHLQKFRKEKTNFSEMNTIKNHALRGNPILERLNNRTIGSMPSIQPYQSEYEGSNTLIGGQEYEEFPFMVKDLNGSAPNDI